MKGEWIANSDAALSKMLGDLRELWREHKYLRVTAKAGVARSHKQNAILHVWYTQLAMEDRQEDMRGHIRNCKLQHGVPLLCAEDSDYRDMCRRSLFILPHESQLEVMDFWPVTRLMTKAQETKYLDSLRDYYGPRGIKLEFPESQPARRN